MTTQGESAATIWGEVPIEAPGLCMAGMSDGQCCIHDCPQAEAEIRRLRAENEELRRSLKATLRPFADYAERCDLGHGQRQVAGCVPLRLDFDLNDDGYPTLDDCRKAAALLRS